MTAWAGIVIITTVIVMGLTMIGVQITMFIYLLRRTDAISERLDEVKERLARLEGILIGRQEVGNGALTQAGDD